MRCTGVDAVEGGSVPGQAGPALAEAACGGAVAGGAGQHEEGLKGLLVERPQPVDQPVVDAHGLQQQRQQLRQLLCHRHPIQAAAKPATPYSCTL